MRHRTHCLTAVRVAACQSRSRVARAALRSNWRRRSRARARRATIDARERAEAQNPARERLIEADVERQPHAAVAAAPRALRRVPLARPHVVGDRRLRTRSPRARADPSGRRANAETPSSGSSSIGVNRSSSSEMSSNALDRERADLAVLRARTPADTARPARRRAGTG